MTWRSFSSAETKKFAEAFAKKILASKKRGGRAVILALEGELGTGKTTFVQGFFRGLGVKKRITSPTFILMRKSAIRHRHHAFVYHVDAYRIKRPIDLLKLGLREILNDSQNIVIIEWADRIRRIIPKSADRIKFSHGERENERRIAVSA